jgi:hypothetical protein
MASLVSNATSILDLLYKHLLVINCYRPFGSTEPYLIVKLAPLVLEKSLSVVREPRFVTLPGPSKGPKPFPN